MPDYDSKRKLDHPEFRYCARHGAAPFVFVFDRSEWIEPTAEQRAKYAADEKIVRAHGGYMRVPVYSIAGRKPRFTKKDCRAMRKLVEAANPDLEFHSDWNGPDCYTYSVGMRKKVT